MANIQTQPATGNLVQPLMINAHPQPSLQIARHAKTFKILGILQLVLGTGSIILGIVVIIVGNIYLNWPPDMGSGIWCGVFFLVSGTLSYLSSKKRDPCLVIAGMIMAIFSAMAASMLFFVEITGTLLLAHLYRIHLTLMKVLQSILCVIAFAELIIAITHSAYCCAASSCCCADTSSRRQMVTVTTGNTNSIPLAMPAQLSTFSNVTQPQFGATVMPINQVPIESYQGFTNQPTGAIQSNNMMTTALTSKDQPTQYQRA